VFTIADTLRDVRARGGLLLRPNFDITNHPAIDLLIKCVGSMQGRSLLRRGFPQDST
jgi:hypothetical protein